MPAYFEAGWLAGNQPAWHGAGVVSDKKWGTIEEVFEDVPELASLVEPQPIYTSYQGEAIEIPGYQAAVRVYDGKVVGVNQGRYNIIQNRTAFGFAKDILDMDEGRIETAGTLNGGSNAWFLLQLPGEIRIGGDESEVILPYLLISNSFDGSSALTAAVTDVRVVCANTLALSINGNPRLYKVRHTDSHEGKLAQAREALQIAWKYTEALETEMNGLLAQPISDEDFERFLVKLLPDPKQGDQAKENVASKRFAIGGIYKFSDNLQNVKGTRYGALQSVAEWHDHHTVNRGSQRQTAAQSRFAKCVTGQNITDKAYTLLKAM
jgi:phage/plasmid-like protein (TIGR03299 family)